MNILLVTMSMNIGGAETHILELAKELKRRENNVYVASAGGKLVPELEEMGIEHILAPLKDKKINHIYESLKIIKDIIKNKEIDVVHAHARIPGAICGIACKKTKTPFVTTAHGMFKVNILFKILTNWGEKTLAVSEDIKKQVVRDYKLNPQNVSVTINGIDTNKFKKQEEELSELRKEIGEVEKGSKVLMHVSRLDKDSSQIADILIESADVLAENKIKLVIVGGGDRLEALKEKASQKNASNIVLLGARTDIHKLLNLADIFVGVSRAALEAMATEVPVILAGNEAYHQGYMGIFEESKLEKALETNFCCRQMKKVTKEELLKDIIDLSHSSIHSDLGKYNRKVVKEFYSVQKMTDDCIKVYKEVIKESTQK